MNVLERNLAEQRETTHSIDEIFLERWSPRAMSGEPVTEEEMHRLFEAARWAPSSYNGQPWRFVYALRDSAGWERLYELLNDFNQKWAEAAGALVVILSRRTFEHNDEPSRTHSFDAGAAWQNLALQGSRDGLVVHGMEGFDYERAREVLELEEEYEIEAMAAVGRPGEVEALPDDLEDRESPSGRKPLDDIVRRI